MHIKQLIPLRSMVTLRKDSIYYDQGLNKEGHPMVGRIVEYDEISKENLSVMGSIDRDEHIYYVRFPDGRQWDYRHDDLQLVPRESGDNTSYLFLLNQWEQL